MSIKDVDLVKTLCNMCHIRCGLNVYVENGKIVKVTGMPEPLVEINPKTARNLDIADGNMVQVESPRGSIEIKAKLTRDIHPKVVSIQHGWSEANVNFLTDDEARDPVSGYPAFKSEMCRVMKPKG